MKKTIISDHDALITAQKDLAVQKNEIQDLIRTLVTVKKELAVQYVEKAKRAEEFKIADKERVFQSEEKQKRADELAIADIELVFQSDEKSKRAAELEIADVERAFQNLIKEQKVAELVIANDELLFQVDEKRKRAEEYILVQAEFAISKKEKEALTDTLFVANTELSFQKEEKGKRAEELGIADIELAYQDDQREKRAAELIIANKELSFQNAEKEKRAAELSAANGELAFQNNEKEKRAAELSIANIELAYQNDEKEKRAEELTEANRELAFQNTVNTMRAEELVIANKELAFQNAERGKRAAELLLANKELAFQNKEKEKRAAELSIANVELAYQNDEKEKRAAELFIANKELFYQTGEKEKRAAELAIADIELAFQNKEKEKRVLENREREQSISYAEGILGTMREPLLVLHKDLRVKSANEAFYRVFSVTSHETEETLVYELNNRCWDTPALREALNKILSERVGFSDLEISCDLPVIGAKTMLLNGHRLIQSEKGEELILLAIQDITEQRALQQRNDSFISMASHELKTPVTTIKMLLQILQVRYTRSADTTLNEYLTTIGLQIEQLTKLVIDLLDVSKIKADKFEIDASDFDFDILAHEIVKSCQLLSPHHTITIEGDTTSRIWGDRNSISRVFINLITNAIKYSPKADTIAILLSRHKDTVRIGVRDFGIGIAKSHQEKIFERFFQVNNTRGQSFAGLGIGLYITAAIVAEHKGRIWVESSGANGSTFFFELPALKKDVQKLHAHA